MPPYTRGFNNAQALTEHYTKHGALLGVVIEQDYLERADIFCGGPRPADVLECTTSTGDRLRFRIATQEYGVLSQANLIRTYHIRSGSKRRDALWFARKCAQ